MISRKSRQTAAVGGLRNGFQSQYASGTGRGKSGVEDAGADDVVGERGLSSDVDDVDVERPRPRGSHSKDTQASNSIIQFTPSGNPDLFLSRRLRSLTTNSPRTWSGRHPSPRNLETWASYRTGQTTSYTPKFCPRFTISLELFATLFGQERMSRLLCFSKRYTILLQRSMGGIKSSSPRRILSILL